MTGGNKGGSRGQGNQGNQGQGGSISTPQLFIITFVGWLILQVLSPEEWHHVIGTFLTVEATVLFLAAAIKSGNPPQNSTIQFLLAAYIGYFIVYGDSSESGQQGGGQQRKGKQKSPKSTGTNSGKKS